MRYRTLGRTQLKVSEVGVGGAQFGLPNYMGSWDPFTAEAQQVTTATIHRALALGYNYFDTAPSYGNGRSEEMVGQALQGHREEVIIATKVTGGKWTPDGIRRSVDASLRRLQVDMIDIIQFHGGWYPRADVDVILEGDGLDTCLRLREEGTIRFIGFLSDPYGDVALVGMRDPRYVEINNAISDDIASRLDLVQLHERYVR
jgi:aryl-alcohol dehydrogenase-like predicted oxidoreductase